ncbi:unnamed protein product, partial [Ectocarpus fasciculatus]
VTAIHNAASTGFSRSNISRYDSGRPSYSQDTLDKIMSVVDSCNEGNPNLSLCEIGAGTGKFTKALVEHLGDREFEMLAIEPSEFVEHLMNLLLPNVSVKIGTGEDIPAEDRCMDGVMIAQAFHWMANNRCLTDIHRVLKPGKPLILVWNGYDTRVNWISHFESSIILPRYPKPPDHVPRFQSMEWQSLFETKEAHTMFTVPKTVYSSKTITGDVNMLINRALSTSVIANKSEAVHEEVADEVRKLVMTHPETRGKDTFDLVYRTHIAYMVKK